MSEPPAILTLPAAVLAFLWAADPGALALGLARAGLPLRADGDVPARIPRWSASPSRARRAVPGPGAGLEPAAGSQASPAAPCCCVAADPADRALDDPQLGRPRPHRADLHRRRQGASTSAPTCPPTANTSGSRRCWYERYDRRSTSTPDSQALDGSTRRRCSTGSPKNAIPDLPARRRPRQDRQGELLQVPRRRPARLCRDDRPQGRPDVGERGRRSDVQHRSGASSRWSSCCSASPGFVLLGLRRRWWELVALATPIVLVTAVGAASLAAPRRNEILMTLVFPLAGLALAERPLAAISSGREWSSPSRHLPRRADGAPRRRPGDRRLVIVVYAVVRRR